MRSLAIGLLLTVALSASARADFEWAFEKEFEFLEFHDPGYLILKDATGKESELTFGYEGLTYAVVNTWSRGKKIRLLYTPEQGTELLDPENGARYPIRAGAPRLDELLEQCLAQNGSTAGKTGCHSAAAEAWDLELNRAYQNVMKSDRSEETRLAVRTAQREWIQYRDASLAANRAVAAEQGGSIRALQVGSAAVALTRDQALTLRRYLDD